VEDLIDGDSKFGDTGDRGIRGECVLNDDGDGERYPDERYDQASLMRFAGDIEIRGDVESLSFCCCVTNEIDTGVCGLEIGLYLSSTADGRLVIGLRPGVDVLCGIALGDGG
jgi:hypothetical protein